MKYLLERGKLLSYFSHWSLLLMSCHEQQELGGACSVKFCHSCDMRKQQWNDVMLCEYDTIFWGLLWSVSWRVHIFCLVSLDQSFFPLLGELGRNITKKSSSNFPFPLLLFMLFRREELIQLFILAPEIELHITKTIKGDFQYKFGSSTALHL